MQRRKCIYNLSHGFELHSIRYRILVIALDFCCIYIGLVFIKDRPVSSFWVLRFRVLGASFSSFGCFVFDLGCFVFEFWVLRFRVLGASCFGLRFRVLRFRNYPSGPPVKIQNADCRLSTKRRLRRRTVSSFFSRQKNNLRTSLREVFATR